MTIEQINAMNRVLSSSKHNDLYRKYMCESQRYYPYLNDLCVMLSYAMYIDISSFVIDNDVKGCMYIRVDNYASTCDDKGKITSIDYIE